MWRVEGLNESFFFYVVGFKWKSVYCVDVWAEGFKGKMHLRKHSKRSCDLSDWRNDGMKVWNTTEHSCEAKMWMMAVCCDGKLNTGGLSWTRPEFCYLEPPLNCARVTGTICLHGPNWLNTFSRRDGVYACASSTDFFFQVTRSALDLFLCKVRAGFGRKRFNISPDSNALVVTSFVIWKKK